MAGAKGSREAVIAAISEMKASKPKGPRSPIRALIGELAALHMEHGFSFQEIAEHLTNAGVEVQSQTVWKYLTEEYGPKLRRAAKIYNVAVPGDLHDAIVTASEKTGKAEREIILQALRNSLLGNVEPSSKVAKSDQRQRDQMALPLGGSEPASKAVAKAAKRPPKKVATAKKPSVKAAAKARRTA